MRLPPLRDLLRAAGLAAVLFCAGPAAAGDAGQDVTVFAAASLAPVMDDLAPLWQQRRGGRLRAVLAGSSALARQIEQGAPADVFVSASADWMDVLDRQGLLTPGTRFDLAGNRLVVIARDPALPAFTLERSTDLRALLKGGRLAMALVDAVPAGIYGREALTALGLWDGLEADVAQADNVRAALALVATGAAPLGIVYATDALAEPAVHVVARIDPALHAPIRYPAAATAGGDAAAAAAFLGLLRNEAARAILTRHGFDLPLGS